MNKFYFLCCFFICCISVFGQINSPAELLTAPLREIQFFDAESAIAFGGGTITRTDDGGQTWNMVSLGMGSREDEPFKECVILDENTAIVLGTRATFLKTINKGLTWQNVTINLGEVESIDYTGISFVDNQTGCIVVATDVNSQRLYKTTDGGVTWNWVSTFGWDYFPILKIKFLDEQTGFAWGGSHIYKTVDGGATWSELQMPAEIEVNDFINTLKIDSGVIVASFNTFNPFYISNDLGDSWENIEALGFDNGFFYEGAIFEFKNNKIYVTGGSGTPSQGNFIIYDVLTDELVANSIPFNITVNTSVRFFDENTGYLITRGNYYGYTPGRKIFRTEDGGVTWEEQDSFTFDSSGVTELKLKKSGSNNYVLSKQDGSSTGDFYVFISDDGGAQWKLKIKEEGIRGKLLFSKGQYISYLLSTPEANVLKESDDFGETWISTGVVDPSGNGGWYGIYSQIDENILIKDIYSNKFFSFDKGQTWHSTPYPQVPGVVFFDVELKSINEVYCWGVHNSAPAQHGYYLYKSANLGQTWQQVVMIPDNNANTFSTKTFVGDAMAMVCTGNNKYYRVNLLDSTFLQIPFTHPLEGHTFAEEETFQLLTDSSWLYNKGAYTGERNFVITNDLGVTWQEINCEVCGRDISFDNLSAEIMTTDKYYGAEKIGTFLPVAPVILGDRECDMNEYREYTIENVNEDTVYWTLVSGGEIIGSDEGNSIQVHWTEGGMHKLIAMRSNAYGDSRYGTAFVDVTSLVGLNDIDGSSVSVVPNPFADHLLVVGGDAGQINKVSILSLTGQVLYDYTPEGSDFIIKGLERLPIGVYFLRMNSVEGTFTKKIIKK